MDEAAKRFPTPFPGRIFIEPFQSTSVLDQGEKKLLEVGKVIAVPPFDGKNIRFFKEGDVIMYKKWGLDIVEHEGKEYYSLLEDKDFVIGKLSL